MYAVYIMWGALPILFIVLLFTMKTKEDKASRRVESAVDPMFRSVPRRRAGAGADGTAQNSASPSGAAVRPTRARRQGDVKMVRTA